LWPRPRRRAASMLLPCSLPVGYTSAIATDSHHPPSLAPHPPCASLCPVKWHSLWQLKRRAGRDPVVWLRRMVRKQGMAPRQTGGTRLKDGSRRHPFGNEQKHLDGGAGPVPDVPDTCVGQDPREWGCCCQAMRTSLESPTNKRPTSQPLARNICANANMTSLRLGDLHSTRHQCGSSAWLPGPCILRQSW
jgi:hypothetical protein